MVTTEQQLKRANAHLLAWKSIISNNNVIETCDVSAFPSVTEALNCVKALSVMQETHVLVTGTKIETNLVQKVHNILFVGSLHLVGCVLGQLEPEEEEESAMEDAKFI